MKAALKLGGQFQIAFQYAYASSSFSDISLHYCPSDSSYGPYWQNQFYRALIHVSHPTYSHFSALNWRLADILSVNWFWLIKFGNIINQLSEVSCLPGLTDSLSLYLTQLSGHHIHNNRTLAGVWWPGIICVCYICIPLYNCPNLTTYYSFNNEQDLMSSTTLSSLNLMVNRLQVIFNLSAVLKWSLSVLWPYSLFQVASNLY